MRLVPQGGAFGPYLDQKPRGAEGSAPLGVETEVSAFGCQHQRLAGSDGGGRPPDARTASSRRIDPYPRSAPGDSRSLGDEAMVLLCRLRRKNPGLDAVHCQNLLRRNFGCEVRLETIRTFLACLDSSRNNTNGDGETKEASSPLSPLESTIAYHKLVPSIDPRRLKFCGEMGLHWLEIFKRGTTSSPRAGREQPPQNQVGPGLNRNDSPPLLYSLVAFMGVRSPGSPLSPPVLYDLSDETLDSRWFRRSLHAAVASQFFDKGDVLVLDPRAITDDDWFVDGDTSKGIRSPTRLPSLDDYLWNLVDPKDGQPLRLCLLWLPFASANVQHSPTNGPRPIQHRYRNPVKLLFGDLLTHLHKYPLDRIQRPITHPHVTAVLAKEFLSSVTTNQVTKWCMQCGYGSDTSKTDTTTTHTATPRTARRE